MCSAGSLRFLSLIIVALCLCEPRFLPAQQDGGATLTDGGGTGVLQSIYVPNLPDAPFSLTLHTEWIQSLRNGGTYTTVSNRAIMRDSAGRLYEERWLLTPKGSDIPSRMTFIQVDDPVAHKFYQCAVRQKVCDLSPSVAGLRHYDPTQVKSGPLTNGKGSFEHEDLGNDSVAGFPAHAYRDTTTLNAGVFGNDAPMATVREFRYSAELGFNLSSILDSPQSGRQVFTVSALTATEPDPKFFQPPEGYKIVDKRKSIAGSTQ